jgi:hypothetical protein
VGAIGQLGRTGRPSRIMMDMTIYLLILIAAFIANVI